MARDYNFLIIEERGKEEGQEKGPYKLIRFRETLGLIHPFLSSYTG